MSLKSSISSTGKEAISSGGASLTDSIKPWGPPSFEPMGTAGSYPPFRFFWGTPITGGQILHNLTVELRGSTEALELPPDVQHRIFCHLLLSWLPNAAIPEALTSLAEVWDFHVLKPPAQFAVTSSPPAVKGRLGQSYERPPFTATED
jgi:hypothetical protein